MKLRKACKIHRCHLCGKRIPIGVNYWYELNGSNGHRKQHTNCDDFREEPELPAIFEALRRAMRRRVK